jgi:O-methyltransferase
MSDSRYIKLLKKSLIDYQNIGDLEAYSLQMLQTSWKIRLLKPIDRLLRTRNFGIFKLKKVEEHKRLNGYDWPAHAATMVGLVRLDNVHHCIDSILKEKIPGDFVETGVWRGGVIMLMKAILEEKNISDRTIWAFDSFQGLPKPKPRKYPLDKGNTLYKQRILSVSLEEVKSNFRSTSSAQMGYDLKKAGLKTPFQITRLTALRSSGLMETCMNLPSWHSNTYIRMSLWGVT